MFSLKFQVLLVETNLIADRISSALFRKSMLTAQKKVSFIEPFKLKKVIYPFFVSFSLTFSLNHDFYTICAIVLGVLLDGMESINSFSWYAYMRSLTVYITTVNKANPIEYSFYSKSVEYAFCVRNRRLCVCVWVHSGLSGDSHMCVCCKVSILCK